MYVFGGYDDQYLGIWDLWDHYGYYMCENVIFDVKIMKFTEGPSMLEGRSGFTAIVMNNN